MRFLLAFVVFLALATPAMANTASDAISTPLDNHELFRPCGQLLSSGFGWNCPTPADAAVDPTSSEQAHFLTDQLGGSWDNPGHWWWSWFNVYTVDLNTPLKRVCLTGVDTWAAGWGDYIAADKVLVNSKVPIPTDPSGTLPWLDGGSDNGATIYQPDSNTAWDFYEFQKAPDGKTDPVTGKPCDFLADVGQRMLTVGKHGKGFNRDGSTYTITYPSHAISPGYYRQNPPSEFSDVARRASKLPVIAGNITPQEFNHPDPVKGFGHKLQVTLPWGRYQEWQWPAHQTDAWAPGGTPAIREGAIIRFKPATDCSMGDSSLYWQRVRAFCVTIRDYGMVGTDQTGNGFAFNFAGGGELASDGGYYPYGKSPNGPHWPNQYIDPIWTLFRDNLEVLLEPAHQEWTPGCRC